MSSREAPIVIVGTGLSGYTLAREIRKHDKEAPVLMITADDGHSYSKPMLSTGFTKGKTADELIQSDAAAITEQLGIELRTHTHVTGIDPEAHEIRIGDEHLAYSRLVLAWGADVIRLNLQGDGQDRVYSINDRMDYNVFRGAVDSVQKVAIMGAGLIGCEFANDLRNGGYEVEVIAPCETAMPGLLPPVAGDAVINGLTELGVRFHLGPSVTRVDAAGEGVRLHLDNGETIEADRAISAVGLRPRTGMAVDAGLDVGRGIRVSRLLETSAPDIYALGDCAEVDGHVLPYVLPLMSCARALAKTLTGQSTEVAYGVMPVMVKTPCCPTAVYPPPVGAEGEWQVEQDGNSVKALFRTPDEQLLGFAVTGDYVIEKQALSKEVPPIHG